MMLIVKLKALFVCNKCIAKVHAELQFKYDCNMGLERVT